MPLGYARPDSHAALFAAADADLKYTNWPATGAGRHERLDSRPDCLVGVHRIDAIRWHDHCFSVTGGLFALGRLGMRQ